MILIKLFYIFSKIGLFSFGGGYAMIPFFQKELVEKLHWITTYESSNIIIISQMTPGAIAISYASFVGYKVAGFLGSIIATIGIILPSALIILLIASIFNRLYEKSWVQGMFTGVKPAIIGLIGAVAYKLTLSNVVNLKSAVIFTISLLLLIYKKLDPIKLLLLAGTIGILIF